MQQENLSDKFAVVTGASRGLGKHIAEALYAAGAKVAITGRVKKSITQSAKDIGEEVYPYVCDHGDADSIRKFAAKVIKEHGAPDILVNNAGLMLFGPVLDFKLEDWDKMLNTNLRGVFLTTQAFLPGMIEKNRGDIYMISSMSGKKGNAGTAGYNASKFGLQGFSQALLYEVRQHNIRVTVLNPSSINNGADTGAKEGPGLHLHAADIAATLVHLCCLPGRTLIRDLDIWGTNP